MFLGNTHSTKRKEKVIKHSCAVIVLLKIVELTITCHNINMHFLKK